MSPDDPRHGTSAGHHAGCREDCCREARNRYERNRRKRREVGMPGVVDPTGTRRRIQALMAMGWPCRIIAERAGLASQQAVDVLVRRATFVRVSTAAGVSRAYDEMCMVPGPSIVTRKRAQRLGYAPPLAWDDIDRDAHPCGVEGEEGGMDPAIVTRCLAGDFAPAKGLARADRVAVADAWIAAGRSQNELERASGWNVTRDRRLEAGQEVSAA